MSSPVIIRLQNLPLEARSIDIRKFFEGLIIPDGGVHIVGGERGDAFIAFQTDEDARRAMNKNNEILCSSAIKLYLSSKTEMQNVIATARNHLAQKKVIMPQQLNSSITTSTSSSNDNLLSSLNKLIQTTSTSTAAASTSSTTTLTTSLAPSLIEQLKSINGLIKTEHSNTLLPLEHQTKNIDINQLLSILTNIPKQETNRSPTQQSSQKSPQQPLAQQSQSVYNRYQTKTQSSSVFNSDGLLPLPSQKISLLPTPSVNETNEQQQFYIRVANFHNTCSFKDIRTFLQGVHVEHDSIKLLTDQNGNRNGSALVRLQSSIDVKKALLKNSHLFDNRQIEVQQVSSSTSNESRRVSFEMQTTNTIDLHGFFAKIYGLPHTVTRKTLLSEFNNVKFKRINKVVNNEGKMKFVCEVETKLDLERALTRQNEIVGGRKIQIYEMSRFEFEQELSLSQPAFGNEPLVLSENENESNNYDEQQSEDENEESTCVLMSGIPYAARDYDVKYFFQNYHIIKIHLLVDKQTHKQTDECCVRFATRVERDRAIRDKDDQLFRNRKVRVKAITNFDLEKLIDSKIYESGSRSSTSRSRPVLLPTPPSHSDDNLTNIQQLVDDNDMNGKHDDEDEYETSNRQQRYGYHKSSRQAIKRTHQQSSTYTSQSTAKRARKINTEDLPPLPPDLQKYDSLVLISNVNYNATRDDILDVMKAFNPICDTLKIRHTDYGKPTGDAIVAFRSLDDATHVTNQLNGSTFMGRTIKAFLYNNRS